MRVKILILAFFAAFTVGTYAQNTKTDSVAKSPLTFRADAGYGQIYRHGDYIGTSPYHVIRVGGTVEYGWKYGLGIETGLKYSYALGNMEQYYIPKDTAFHNYNGHFLDIPIRVTYSVPIFWGMKLFAYAGPNINVGLAQTNKLSFEKKSDDVEGWEPLDYPTPGTYDVYNYMGKDGVGMNRVSIQLGAGGGIQWKNYRIRSGYDWGLNNIGKDKNRTERLRGWHVAFEYEF